MTENSLTLMSQASRMLAEATTIQAAKELKDLALTAADWARRKGMGEEAVQHAKGYAFDAERKMGEMLKATERHPPGPEKIDRLQHVTDPPPTLADLGITKRESSEAQTLADLPEETFETIVAGGTTLTQVKREAKREQVKERLEDLAAREVEQPTGKYDVIVIDPPWPMLKIEREVAPEQVEFDYPTMSIDDIASMDIPAADDCHLWL